MKKKEDGISGDAYENDILAPFIEDRSQINKVLDAMTAKKIKNEILKKFRERIISRADIIDNRIKEERTKVGPKLI